MHANKITRAGAVRGCNLYISFKKTIMKTIVLILFLSAAFGGCKKSPAPASSADENIKIKMVEEVDSTKRILVLNCYTENNFPCSNYSIESSFGVTNDKVVLTFSGISSPGICLTAIGPASATINLGSLSDKTYNLDLNIQNAAFSGQLTLTAANYKVTLPATNRVQFINPDLYRVPDNTIYGTVHYHTASTGSLADKFLDSLQYFGAVSTSYLPGDYGRFQIESNGQIKQTQDAGYNFTRYFIFNYTNSSAPLKALVKRFGQAYPGLLLITLNTTKGETFYSWVP